MKKILLLLLPLLACGPGDMEHPKEQALAGSILPRITPEQGFPLLVHLPAGNKIELDEAPKRVLPANAGIADFLSLILLPEQVAALPKLTREYSRIRGLQSGPWGEVPIFERFGAEEILSCRPDLVLTNDWQSPESNQILRDNGVALISLPTPQNWDQVLQQLSWMGRLCGREAQAQEVRAQLAARRMALEQHELYGSGLSVLSYSNFGGGGFSSGSGTTMNILLGLAGFENAASRAGLKGDCTLNFEQLITINPDFLLLSQDEDGNAPAAQLLSARTELAGLKALSEHNLTFLHKALFSSTSTELIEAAEALQRDVQRALATSE